MQARYITYIRERYSELNVLLSFTLRQSYSVMVYFFSYSKLSSVTTGAWLI